MEYVLDWSHNALGSFSARFVYELGCRIIGKVLSCNCVPRNFE